ncbi:MAG: DUF4432 family protein [Actinobacteria bacterium]|nr:DUF4432 family protein [Actinomycetota bacterium]
MDKGSDIFEILYKPFDIDFMWQSPIVPKNRSDFIESIHDTRLGNFLDFYGGGWQEILPNIGPPCIYEGTALGTHGESSLVPWDLRIIENSEDKVSVELRTLLYRFPFEVKKTITIEKDKPSIFFEEILINHGNQNLKYLWGHHPAFGGEFLSEDCEVNTSFAKVFYCISDYKEIFNEFVSGESYVWPQCKTLQGVEYVNKVHKSDAEFGYSSIGLMETSKDANSWYYIFNRNLSLGFGIFWDCSVFNTLNYWRLSNSAKGYPWFGNGYTVALELFNAPVTVNLDHLLNNWDVPSLKHQECVSTSFKVVIFLGSEISMFKHIIKS